MSGEGIKYIMATVVLMAGLPGSGKTWLIINEYKGYLMFDDYKNKAINDSCRFNHSRHFHDLTKALKNDDNCVVSDIDFCRTEARDEADHFLKEYAPDAKRKWIFWENNPNACRCALNYLKETKGRDITKKLEKLEYYTERYNIPTGVIPRRIWQPPDKSELPDQPT
jgi:hypothetical protein